MIIDIDHITLNSIDFTADSARFADRGYRQSFINTDLLNAPLKQQWLREWQPKHDIAFLKAPAGNVNIELVNHHHQNEQEGYLMLVDDSTIRVTTSDLARSLLFWQMFGFREQALTQTQARLEWQSIFQPKPYQIYLEQAAIPTKHYIDDSGFNCLAFMTSSVEHELQRFQDAGYKVGHEIATQEINHRLLQFAFIRGPGGEIVELLSTKQ